MNRTGTRPPRTIPVENAAARGLEFPAENAGARQIAALERLLATYIREEVARRFKDLPASPFAMAYGLGLRQTKDFVSRARSEGRTPMARLVLDVLQGMLTGTLPSVLNTPKNQWTRWLFEQIYHYDLTDWRREVLDEDTVWSDWDALHILHAAFQRDYRDWLRRK